MSYSGTVLKSLFIALILFFLSAVLCGEASSFNLRKNNQNNYYRWLSASAWYRINVKGTKDDTGEFTAIQNAFQAWEDVEEAAISFTYRGTTKVAKASLDFTNAIFWIESGWPSDLGPSVVAHTKVWTGAFSNILDADIFFNGQHYNWSSDLAPNTLDIQNIAIHEIGHFIGIEHSDDPDATMDPTIKLNETEKRSLEQDDIDAVSFLYPSESVEIEIVSGNNQKGEVGIPLPEPMVVRVTDSEGEPVSGSFVIFDLTEGNGVLEDTTPVRTDESGLAQTTFTPESDELINIRVVAAGLENISFTVEKADPLPSQVPPEADAGPDQTVTDANGDGIEIVNLDGSESSDPDGTIVSYTWLESGLQIATGESPEVSLSVGTHTLTLEVTDNDGATDTGKTTITVIAGPVVPPIITSDPVANDGSVLTDEDVSVSGTLSASDADGDSLTFSIVSGAAQGTVTLVDATSGQFTYTPNANANGSDNFTFKVNDGTADSNTAAVTVTINPVNDAPVITSSPPAKATEDVVYSYYPKVTDVDGTDTLSWVLGSAPQGMVVDSATGAIFWAPEEGVLSSGLISTIVDDGNGGTDSQEFTIVVTPVNDAPTISGTPVTVVDQSVFYSFTPEAEDAEADALTFSIANEPSWTIFDSSTGSLVGTPGNEDVGTTSGIVITVSDGELSASLPSFDLTVAKHDLEEGLIAYWPFDEGSGTVVQDYSGSGNDGNVFGADWTAGKIGGALIFDGVNDHVRIPNSPSLSLDTNKVTFAFWIYANESSNGWSTIMHRTMNNNNWFDWQLYARASDAPTINHPVFRANWDDDLNIDKDEEVEGDTVLSPNTWYFIACTYDGLEMKYYIDGTLRGAVAIEDGAIPNGGMDIWIGGNTPWGEFFDGVIDEVRIYNRSLGEDEIQQLAGVEPPNRSPAASAGTASTDEDVSFSGMLSASDPDGDSLTYSIVSGTTKGMVTLVDAATGDFTYTPEENANGSDSFAFKVNDGEVDSNTVTVSVTINPVNDSPVISGVPALTINEGDSYSFTPDAQDVDGDQLTFSIVSKPSWANFDSGSGSLTVTAGNGDVGTTTGIVITVSDGELFASLPPFNLTVNNVNDVPVANDGSVLTDEDVSVSGTLSASDADGDSLTFSIVSGAAQGTVTLVDATSGQFTYTPNANANGSDNFTFKVNDGTADSNTAAVTVTINPVNDAPVITSSPPAKATEDVVYSYYPKVTDVDGTDTLSWVLGSAPQGMVVDSATGAIFWAPEEGVLSSGLISTIVDDGNGGTASQEFTIVVTPVNDAPTISGTPVTVVDQSVFYSFTPEAEDAEADALSFSIANEPSWTIFDSSTGSLTGTPGNEDVGTTSGIVITVSDGELSASLPSFDLTVAKHDLEEGLIAYWPFDEGSGTVVQDYSGSGNDGNVFGADWTAGKIGGALIFDGVNDHVRIPNSPSLSLDTNKVTFAFWIYANESSNGWSTIMHRTMNNNNWFDWQLYARASDAPTINHPVFRANWDDDLNIDKDEEVEGDTVLSPNTWYFIACTYDGLEMKYYIDGTLRGAVAIEDGAIPNGGMDIWIGGNTPWGEFFDGVIDEVRIYNRSLGEDEIQLLYEQASTN